MAYNYIPKYIRQSENKSPKSVVTASRWNELFNLLIQQGDHTAEELGNILNYFSTRLVDVESEISESAEAIANIHEVFRINVTYSNGVYSADKTFAEIKAAYEAGQQPYVVYDGNTIYTLSYCYFASEQMFMNFERYLIGEDTLKTETLRIYSYTTASGSNIVKRTSSFDVPSGTSDHSQLTNRDATNQHPITAITGLQTALDGKANAADIPSLEGYATEAYVQTYHDNTKQDTITDLAAIRSGASKGATAVQPEVGKGLFSGSYNDLTDKPTIPTALPNPNAITFTGAVTGSYDGSEALTVEIPSGGGSTVELDTTLTQSGKAADAKAVGDALAEMEAAYQPDLPEGYIYVQEIPENADTSKIYVLPDGYAYEYSEHTVVEKHNANTGLVNIKPETNANYQSLSAQSGVLTSDLIPFSADWVPSSADRANSTIKVSGIAKLVPAHYNSAIIVYLYYADGSWMGTARTSQIDSLGNPALGSEVSVPVEWYLKDTNSAGVVGGWSNVGYVRVLLGISTSGDITAEDVAGVVINVPFYDTEQVVTGWARNGEKFAISFSDAVGQNTRDIDALDVRVSALEKSGGEETTVQTNQILYAVGDSITYGYGVGGNSGSWVRHVIDRNGYDATNSRNLGESGLGFCTASTSNHTVQDIVGSTDFSGADIVTVALGINDWKNYNALLTDVWSGMEYVFGKIRTDNPYCKIYFIVPFNVSIATSAYATFYGLGYAGDNNPLRPYAHTLLEFIGMLKERFALSPLNAYNVQIIDLTEGVAINRQNITTALIDNLHPTAETHIELGKEIAPILRFNNHYGQTAVQVQSAIGAIQAWQGGSY